MTGQPARVLQVVLSLNPGGTERLVIELASELHATIPMAVCCLDEPGVWRDSLRERGIEVSSVGRRSGFQPGVGRVIAQAARAHQASIVHAHHYSPFVYGAIARLWRPSLRLVFTEHGRLSDAPPSARRRRANRLLSKAPHRVFAVSEDLRRHIVAEGFSERQVDVIYNGISVGPPPTSGAREHVRSMLGVGEETFVVGTIARLDPVKDLETLITAVGYLTSERRVRLVVVGDGPELTRLKQAAGARGLSSEITFLGHQDKAREWLAGFDVYVNSSTSEGISLTILEAMAAKLAVVATAVGGTPEVITEQCGRLIPAGNAIAIATALRSLAKDRSLRDALGNAARRRVEDRFTLDRMVGEYADAYRGVLGSQTA